MANHGYVITKKHMTREKVTESLNKLNKELLFDCLNIELCDFDSGEQAWSITVDGTNDSRVCWLNNRQSFEIRHGGGSPFIWWIDSLIQDTISKEFDGRVKDDGCTEGWDTVIKTWNTPLTFPESFKKQENCLFTNLYLWRRWRRNYPKKYKLGLKQSRKIK